MAAYKIDLFLLGRKGEAVLSRVLAEQPELVSSVTAAKDPGVDDDRFEEIKSMAVEAGIKFADRTTPLEHPAMAAIAVGWRWIIGYEYKPLVVLHDSLLPRYRGFNPLVSCLINQESQIGVTALLASAEYDRGPILAQQAVPIRHPMRIADAIDRLLPLYADLASQACLILNNGGGNQGKVQDEVEATYSLWRDDADYRIDWTLDADRIHRSIWALGSPYAGAKTLLDGRLIRIDDVEPMPDVRIENRIPGKVIFMAAGLPVVVCGTGLLKITKAAYEDDGSSTLPLARFRSRFV